jgi:hypothetical protein
MTTAPADHAFVEDTKTGNPLEEILKSRKTLLRCLFILVSCLLASVAMFASSVIVVIGFFYLLFTGEVNAQIRDVGQRLPSYLYNILCYLTFKPDERAFPLGGKWPSGISEAE